MKTKSALLLALAAAILGLALGRRSFTTTTAPYQLSVQEKGKIAFVFNPQSADLWMLLPLSGGEQWLKFPNPITSTNTFNVPDLTATVPQTSRP